jgi:hypothetical protein
MQAPQVMSATAQVQVPYLLGLDRLFTVAGFVRPEVPAMTPGIDDPLHGPCPSTEMSLS